MSPISRFLVIFTRYRVITDRYWLPYWLLRLTAVTVTGNVQLRRPPPSPCLCYDFEDYVSTLVSWEQDLLHDIDFHVGPFELIQRASNLDPDDGGQVVSDGGAKRNITMGFGLVVGTLSGEYG